jgi:hypothetical protein
VVVFTITFILPSFIHFVSSVPIVNFKSKKVAIVESLGLQCASSHDEKDIYTMLYTKTPYNNKFKLLSFVMKMPIATKRC